MGNNTQDPIVSIACLTFNHTEFITQAIDSFASQKTNFHFEIVVGDGGSTDGNREKIEELANKYSNIHFQLVFPDKDPGIFGTIQLIIQNARGKYLAFCEGDDFWTHPEKLQIQIDYMETQPNCSLCFHRIGILKDGQIFNKQTPVPVNPQITDLIQQNFLYTPTCVYRKSTLDHIPQEFLSHNTADYFLHVLAASQGEMHYIDEEMAVYRLHDGGYWLNRTEKDRLLHMGHVYLTMYNYFSKEGKLEIAEQLLLRKGEIFLQLALASTNETEQNQYLSEVTFTEHVKNELIHTACDIAVQKRMNELRFTQVLAAAFSAKHLFKAGFKKLFNR